MERVEPISTQVRSERLLNSFWVLFNNRQLMYQFFGDGHEQEKILGEFTAQINSFSSQEKDSFLGEALAKLGRDYAGEDEVKKRFALLELLKKVDFEEIGQDRLLELYTNAVAKVGTDEDPHAGIFSLWGVFEDKLSLVLIVGEKAVSNWDKVKKAWTPIKNKSSFIIKYKSECENLGQNLMWFEKKMRLTQTSIQAAQNKADIPSQRIGIEIATTQDMEENTDGVETKKHKPRTKGTKTTPWRFQSIGKSEDKELR